MPRSLRACSACCSTCAHAQCQEDLYATPAAVGYVFYHQQDLECAAGGLAAGPAGACAAQPDPAGTRCAGPPRAEQGELWLGHSARDGMPDNVTPLVAAQMLRDQGLEVQRRGAALAIGWRNAAVATCQGGLSG